MGMRYFHKRKNLSAKKLNEDANLKRGGVTIVGKGKMEDQLHNLVLIEEHNLFPGQLDSNANQMFEECPQRDRQIYQEVLVPEGDIEEFHESPKRNDLNLTNEFSN